MSIPASWLCAGQGAQFVGMGRDLAAAQPDIGALFQRANQVLGYDLARLCFEGPESELVQSQHCQPAIFLVSVAGQRALSRRRPELQPAALAGLSLGEWTALCLADVIGFEDGLRVLAARGGFMQAACAERPGAMLSVIGLELDRLRGVAREAGVEIANLNSPEQTVLSGPVPGIEQAASLAAAAGAKRAVRLNVAGAFHSSLMAPAAERLAAFLREVPFRAPRAPVLSNVTGRPHGAPEEIKAAMVRQVTAGVQWTESVRWLEQQGIRRHVEFGPGRVLSGLVKRIQPGAELLNVQDVPSLAKTAAALGAASAGGGVD